MSRIGPRSREILRTAIHEVAGGIHPPIHLRTTAINQSVNMLRRIIASIVSLITGTSPETEDLPEATDVPEAADPLSAEAPSNTSFAISLERYLGGLHPRGCTAEEIAHLESIHDVRLPDDYHAFLLLAGRGASGLWVGSDYRLGRLSDMQEGAVELMAESGLEFPKGAFAFLMHRGYQFFYLTDDGVYYYYEGRTAAERRYGSFAEFFEAVKEW